nr:MAG TPA: hypothetical protein [Caudoviricetes sp.]
MKAKQEYIDALRRMEGVYYNFDGCMSSMNKFKEDINLLTGLVNEHFEEKQETNLDHYFEDLLKTGGRYAFVNGKIKHCWNTRCCDCAFKGGNCHGEKIKWLASPYEKQTYKLTQFEYDLLQHFSVDFKFKEMGLLKEMKEKGHFKNINGDELIKDILESCEVIK